MTLSGSPTGEPVQAPFPSGHLRWLDGKRKGQVRRPRRQPARR